MKNTGIVRKLDELGRITLPKELRRTFEINEGDSVEIYVDEDAICLKPVPEKKCKFCGSDSNLYEVDGVYICRDCAHKILDKFKEA